MCLYRHSREMKYEIVITSFVFVRSDYRNLGMFSNIYSYKWLLEIVENNAVKIKTS